MENVSLKEQNARGSYFSKKIRKRQPFVQDVRTLEDITDDEVGELFFSTIAGYVTHWRIIAEKIMELMSTLLSNIGSILVLIAIIALSTYFAASSPSGAMGVLVHAERAFKVADRIIVAHNSLMMFTPETNMIWNYIYRSLSFFYRDSRDYFCVKYPPTSLSADCPRLVDAFSIFYNLLDYSVRLFTIVSGFIEELKVALAPIICQGGICPEAGRYTSSLDSATQGLASTSVPDGLTGFLLFEWIMEFASWVLSDCIGSIVDLIKLLLSEVVGMTGQNPLLSFRDIWTLVMASTSILFKAGIALFSDLFLSFIDRLFCSLFVLPGPCFMKDVCKLIFKDFYIPLPFFCIRGKCPKIYFPIGIVCKVFVGTCHCYMCTNPWGVGVPCVLGPPGRRRTCPCNFVLSIYPKIDFLLAIMGLSVYGTI